MRFHGNHVIEIGKSTSLQGNPKRAARKRPMINSTDSQAAVTRLAVPYMLSFVHRMRYNQRAVKKVLVVAKIDLKLAVPMEMETNRDEGSRRGTAGGRARPVNRKNHPLPAVPEVGALKRSASLHGRE